jgi:hypothetical protein
MPSRSYLELLAGLSPSARGLYWAGMSVLCGLIAQEAANRERLIDYLLLVRADLSPTERKEPHGLWLQVIIDHLEDLERRQLDRETRRPSPD